MLANDTDADGGPKTIASVTQPANGTVVITGGGTGLTYQPDADYCNDPGADPSDDFTYTLNGGSTATVAVTVTCVDDDPVAVDDAATVAEDSGATAIDVLANDTDPTAARRRSPRSTQPGQRHRRRSPAAAPGSPTSPNADYCNDPGAAPSDDFTYTLNGGSTATVAVTVTCVDDDPVAVDDAATVAEDSGRHARSTCSQTTPTPTAARRRSPR